MEGLEGTITYIDDVLVHSPTHQQHLQDLEGCLQRLQEHGLKLNLDKCIFSGSRIPYLGFMLTPEGVLPGDDKTKAVREFAMPTNVRKVREFLGLVNYFRHMIPHHALYTGHLSKLTSSKNPWEGGLLPEAAQQAFLHLKKVLCSQPVLGFPKKGKPFFLHTDAATGDKDNPGGLGAVLTQEDEEGKEYAVAYASRSLKDHEKNYGAFLLEQKAAVWAMDHFDVYLKGRKFDLFTDHRPLTALSTRQQKTYTRLQEQLCDYDFELKYRPGKENVAPDALSRNAINSVLKIKTAEEEAQSEEQPKPHLLGMNPEELVHIQRSDPLCQLVLRYLIKQELPIDQEAQQKVLRWARKACIRDNLLFVVKTQETGEDKPDRKSTRLNSSHYS